MRGVYAVLGFIFFGIGAAGAVLPMLPTTPFLLVAAFFFARGNRRFYDWFVSRPLYRDHLQSFVKARAMTLKTKLSILALATAMLMIAFFMMHNVYGRVVILCVMACKYWYFFARIRTLPAELPVPVDENAMANESVPPDSVHK